MVLVQQTVSVQCVRIDKIGNRWFTGFAPAKHNIGPDDVVLGSNGFTISSVVEPAFERGRTYDLVIRESED